MCMNPSPWVWIPTRTFGLSAAVSKVAGGESHSPQMFAPSAACQWSPGAPVVGSPGWGGTADELLGRARITPTTPNTTIRAIAP